MRILVPTAGPTAARETADYVVGVARRIGADIVALHVLQKGEARPDDGPAVLVSAGEAQGVAVESLVVEGEIVETISSRAATCGADLIVMGASEGRVVSKWLGSRVMDQSSIPVLVVPHGLS